MQALTKTGSNGKHDSTALRQVAPPPLVCALTDQPLGSHILKSQVGRSYFMEYLVSNKMQENLLFLVDVAHFQVCIFWMRFRVVKHVFV
jgi:hypothetical protein